MYIWKPNDIQMTIKDQPIHVGKYAKLVPWIRHGKLGDLVMFLLTKIQVTVMVGSLNLGPIWGESNKLDANVWQFLRDLPLIPLI